MTIFDIFPGLLVRNSKKGPNGNKNASHTKKGPGRFHAQGKKP